MSQTLVHDFADGFMPPNLKEQALDMDFHWVNQTGKTARLTGGLRVQPTVNLPSDRLHSVLCLMKHKDDFTTCPPLDIVLMGAHKQSYHPNDTELAFVRKSYETCSAFITVCGGFQAALEAGLFVGKTVTAPRLFLSHLREAAPQTEWVAERWHRDGKLWTSGALLNGLDLIRAFVTEYWGGKGSLAEFCVELGHFPKRDIGYADATSEL